MRWNPEQMGRLEAYLVNINNDSLRQIIEGHFSSQLDLLHEESLQLLDQVKQQQLALLNYDEEPLNIAINQVFLSVRTEHKLDGLAKFLFAKESSSNADPWQQEAIKSVFSKNMRLSLFIECWRQPFPDELEFHLTMMIFHQMQSISLGISDEDEKSAAIGTLWKMTVGLFEQLLQSGLDPNAVAFYNGNTVLHEILAEFGADGRWKTAQIPFYCLSRIIRMFIKAGYRLHQTNDDNETVYETIKNNDEMAAFLSPSLRKTTGRLDSLAANAVLKHWIPHLGEAMNYPSVLVETIKQHLCHL